MNELFEDLKRVYPFHETDHGVLVLGDNMDVMEHIPNECFDLLLTDPPYGIKEHGGASHDRDHWTEIGGKKVWIKKTGYSEKDWDNGIPSPDYFMESMRCSKNQIYFGANYFQDVMVPDTAIPVLPATNSWLIWYKKINGNFSDVEMAWTSFGRANKLYEVMWNGFLQDDMGKGEQRFHPTQKPIKLMRYILNDWAKKGQAILDTHAGSCSVAIAAIDLGMKYLMIEQDKEYFYKASKRIEHFKYGLSSKMKADGKEMPQIRLEL